MKRSKDKDNMKWRDVVQGTEPAVSSTQFSCCIEMAGLQGVVCDMLQDTRLRFQYVAKRKLNAVIPVDSRDPPADNDPVMQVPVAGSFSMALGTERAR